MIQLEFIETLARLNAHDFGHSCITLDDLGADLVGADAVPMKRMSISSTVERREIGRRFFISPDGVRYIPEAPAGRRRGRSRQRP